LFFRASTELDSTASTVVPLERLAELWPAWAEADVELDAEPLPDAWAFLLDRSREVFVSCEPFAEVSDCASTPDLSALTEVLLFAEVLVCELAEVCAEALHVASRPASNTNQIRFMV
jgi:hypothetical protein